jgi:OmpA-OmpF porin, OOP family
VNADGCPLDADGDGVPDGLDRCPDSPPGLPVGPDGCPLDSDGDGIPDHLDECPNTPPGAKVLPNGCALEGDCRRPRPGEQVDANGCAIDRSFILRGVKFEFDSDRLTPEAREILNDVAETLKAYPNIDVELEGHTDAIGSDNYNLGLSERRANSVKAYLEGRGIPARRMRPVGYGESQPIASNDTDEGREENRRVELTVIE